LHLHGTLEDLSDAERQIAYKAAVPFVHVPIELLAQWNNNARMLREVEWFQVLFSPEEKAAMVDFDRLVDSRIPSIKGLRDVPEVLELPAWQEIMGAAARLLPMIPPLRSR
jgi:hypothetical protein